MEDGNDDNEHAASNFLTPDEFLKLGLKLVGYTKRRIQRSKKRSNVERFLGHFGSIPCVCASIWEDLQTTQLDATDAGGVFFFLVGGIVESV
jgi:hypothetical protein